MICEWAWLEIRSFSLRLYHVYYRTEEPPLIWLQGRRTVSTDGNQSGTAFCTTLAETGERPAVPGVDILVLVRARSCHWVHQPVQPQNTLW